MSEPTEYDSLQYPTRQQMREEIGRLKLQAEQDKKRIAELCDQWDIMREQRNAAIIAQEQAEKRVKVLEAHNTDMDCQAVVALERRVKELEAGTDENYPWRAAMHTLEMGLAAKEKELAEAKKYMDSNENEIDRLKDEVGEQSSVIAGLLKDIEKLCLCSWPRCCHDQEFNCAFGEGCGILRQHRYNCTYAQILSKYEALARTPSDFAKEAEAVEAVVEALKARCRKCPAHGWRSEESGSAEHWGICPLNNYERQALARLAQVRGERKK